MTEVKEVYVKVSKNIYTESWVDEISGITFSKLLGKIFIPQDTDVRNIKRWVYQNLLYVISGDLNTCKPSKVKEKLVKEPEVAAPIPEPSEELSAEVEKALEDMDIEELKAIAAIKGIDLGRSTSQKGILAKLQAVSN